MALPALEVVDCLDGMWILELEEVLEESLITLLSLSILLLIGGLM
jgi:hypothetical protein